MQLIRASIGAVLILRAVVVTAAQPERLLSHYTHQRWSDESEAPRPTFALAQDSRGYLWVAAAAGLFRFDGIRFEQVSAGIDLVANGAPSAILVRRDGDVWTNFERSGRFAVYRGGQLRFLNAPPAPHRVMTMHESSDGTVWVLTERVGVPLLRYRRGAWTSFGAAAGAPRDNPYSMVVTGDGTVWVSFTGSVARLAPGASRFEFIKRDYRAYGRLSLDPQQRVWITDRHGTYPLTGPNGRGHPPRLRYAYPTDAALVRGRPMFDREGNFWIATYYDGLQRIAHPDARGPVSVAEGLEQVERYTVQQGLSSNATNQVYQDSEGNVWAATDNGLDRFWPATIRFAPQLTEPAPYGDILLRASDGSVYIGEESTVYRVRPDHAPEPIFHTDMEPRSLCEAPDGAIWISLHKNKKIVIWRDGRVRELPQPIPLGYTVYDCAFDNAGDFWVTASFGGMARLHRGRWERMFGPSGPAFLPKGMITDAQQRLIVHWNDNTIGRIDGARRTGVKIPFDGYAPDDVTLYRPSANEIYVAGRFGLGRMQAGQFRTIPAKRVPEFSGVNGIVRTTSGETWLASPGGILRVRTADLELAFDRPSAIPKMQIFGARDGLRSRPHSHSRASIVQGGDGRLWIAVQGGTLWLDPKQVTRSRIPPAVAVSALVADRAYRDPKAVTLPAGTRDLHVDFSVFSFSNPRAARVRYRVDGQDSDWIEAGNRRQAFYTNLAPGRYRFRLVAANDHGVWNPREATVDFVIPPTFVQSDWFIALCALLAALCLWIAYRVRVGQIARSLRARLEERLGERERIARELHDTLLQGVQGLVLRFQAVANKMPPEEASRVKLDTALRRADEVIVDARNRVQNLRAADAPAGLPELLRSRASEAPFDPPIPIRIVVEGRAREVDPLVAVELARIVDEALLNAARHAKASSIEIMLRFGPRHLGLEVRDDGVGFSQSVLDEGQKDGHFGLVGMRERTERLGGDFTIESDPAIGATVAVTLPARIAYAGGAPNGRWPASLFRRRRDAEHV
jgi:signal transduction histidine kinase/ligand-binding sensor domain-containing protein